MTAVAGNVRDDGGFARVWRESPLLQSLRDPALLGGRCGACEFRELCGGCRCRAYAHTGDVLAEDPGCTYVPTGVPLDERPLVWSPAARARLERIPIAFIRGKVERGVEAFARRQGAPVVTPELMEAAIQGSGRAPAFGGSEAWARASQADASSSRPGSGLACRADRPALPSRRGDRRPRGALHLRAVPLARKGQPHQARVPRRRDLRPRGRHAGACSAGRHGDRALGNRLPAGCLVYTSNLRVRVPASGLSTYPDVSVICGPVQRADDDPLAVVNPVLLVEITSHSTEDYDRGEKLRHYQQLPTLREVMFVSHRRPHLVVHRREQRARGA